MNYTTCHVGTHRSPTPRVVKLAPKEHSPLKSFRPTNGVKLDFASRGLHENLPLLEQPESPLAAQFVEFKRMAKKVFHGKTDLSLSTLFMGSKLLELLDASRLPEPEKLSFLKCYRELCAYAETQAAPKLSRTSTWTSYSPLPAAYLSQVEMEKAFSQLIQTAGSQYVTVNFTMLGGDRPLVPFVAPPPSEFSAN